MTPAIAVLGVLGLGLAWAQQPEPRPPGTIEVRSAAAGPTTIIALVPDTKLVKKGELICELDSAALRDQLDQLRIETERAKADMEIAANQVETAELARKEYDEGLLPQELELLEGKVTLARGVLVRAEERLATEEKRRSTGGDPGPLNQAKVAVVRAKVDLNDAQTRLKTMKELTGPKESLKRRAEVEKAQDSRKHREAIHTLRQGQEDKRREMIANCRILAPADGRVIWANPPRPIGKLQPKPIEEGATVFERQVILRIVPTARGPESPSATPKFASHPGTG